MHQNVCMYNSSHYVNIYNYCLLLSLLPNKLLGITTISLHKEHLAEHNYFYFCHLLSSGIYLMYFHMPNSISKKNVLFNFKEKQSFFATLPFAKKTSIAASQWSPGNLLISKKKEKEIFIRHPIKQP